MNIYQGETMDLVAARAELENTSKVQSAEARRDRYAEISAAAQLDIAASLRIIAEESRFAMQGETAYFLSQGFETSTEEPTTAFDVGDVVYVEGVDGPGEIVGFRDSEGETFAKVRYPDVDGEKVGITAPVSIVHRLVGDEGDEPDPLGGVSVGDPTHDARDEADVSIDEALAHTPLSTEIAPEDVVDDIDADFDGDTHTAAESALDVLKANEAARKAGTKKGKKR